MQTLTLDKKSNPEVAAMAADLQPGSRVTLYTTVKANDDQTLTLTLEEAEAPAAEEVSEEEEGSAGVLPDA